MNRFNNIIAFFSFDTRGVGGFVFSDQFLQMSALMPSKYIYGLGERRNNFLLDVNWQEITLFNHDTGPTDNVCIIWCYYGVLTVI